MPVDSFSNINANLNDYEKAYKERLRGDYSGGPGANLPLDFFEYSNKSYELSPEQIAKPFIGLADFYNFIKSSTAYVPTPFFYFTVNFYPFSRSMVSLDDTIYDTFLDDHMSDLAALKYLIQFVSFPEINRQSWSDGIGSGSETADINISNIYGGQTLMKNGYMNYSQQTLKINVLNTQRPIVENFIYPWFLEAMRTNISNAPIPKVNMAVKFWHSGNVQQNMEGVNPDFIYYATGLYPISIDTWNPQHLSDDKNLNRDTTFAFNDFVIITSNEQAAALKLSEFKVAEKNTIRKESTEHQDKYVNVAITGSTTNINMKKIHKDEITQIYNLSGLGAKSSTLDITFNLPELNFNFWSKPKLHRNVRMPMQNISEDNYSGGQGSEKSVRPSDSPIESASNTKMLNRNDLSNVESTATLADAKRKSLLNSVDVLKFDSAIQPNSNTANSRLKSSSSSISKEKANYITQLKNENTNRANLSLNDSIEIVDRMNVDSNLGSIVNNKNEKENVLDRASFAEDETPSNKSANIDRDDLNEYVVDPSLIANNGQNISTTNVEEYTVEYINNGDKTDEDEVAFDFSNALGATTSINLHGSFIEDIEEESSQISNVDKKVIDSATSFEDSVLLQKDKFGTLIIKSVQPNTNISGDIVDEYIEASKLPVNIHKEPVLSPEETKDFFITNSIENREKPLSNKQNSLVNINDLTSTTPNSNAILALKMKSLDELKQNQKQIDISKDVNARVSNMSMQEHIDMLKAKNSDEDFEEIVDRDDEYDQNRLDFETNKDVVLKKIGADSTNFLGNSYKADLREDAGLVDYTNYSNVEIIKRESITETVSDSQIKTANKVNKKLDEVVKNGIEYQTLPNDGKTQPTISKDDLNAYANLLPNTIKNENSKSDLNEYSSKDVLSRHFNVTNDVIQNTSEIENVNNSSSTSTSETNLSFNVITAYYNMNIQKEVSKTLMNTMDDENVIDALNSTSKQTSKNVNAINSNSNIAIDEIGNSYKDFDPYKNTSSSQEFNISDNDIDDSINLIKYANQQNDVSLNELNSNKTQSKSFTSIMSESKIDDIIEQQKKQQNVRDYDSIKTMLTNGNSITEEKIKIIKEYAGIINTSIKDVILSYKSEKKEEVIEDIIDQLKRQDGFYGKIEIENGKIKPHENVDAEKEKKKTIEEILNRPSTVKFEIKDNRPVVEDKKEEKVPVKKLSDEDILDIF